MTTHTRRKRSKAGLGLGVFVLLAGAVGYFAGRSERSKDVAPPDAAESVDTDRLDVPRTEISIARPGSGALPEAPAAPAAPAPRPAGSSLTAGEGWAKSSGAFGAILDTPAKFMLKKSYLGKPASFQKFASDPKKVDAWLKRPLVRAVTGSPALTRLLVLRPGVMRSFLDSPAMKDPRAIAALGRSPLLKELAQRPGVKAALSDQALVKRALMGPEVMGWLAKHPEGMTAFQQMSAASSGTSRR